MIYLRQSTASQEIPLGYFVDSTDGNTEETALSIANTDIKVWKTGATTLANKNSGGATHISNGIYYCVMDATDTDTIGPLVVFCHVAGALTVRQEVTVLDEAIYDVMFGTTAPATATNITAGTITTVTNLTNAPGAGDFTATMKTSIGTAVAASAVASVTGNVGGNVSGSVGSVVGAVGSVTGNVGGNVTGSVGSVVGAVGSVTGAVGSVTGLTASDVGAIKAKTDSLNFTVAGNVNANIQYVNDVAITGDGQSGTEWGP